MTLDSYGTARLLLRDAGGIRIVVARCGAGSRREVGIDAGEIPVEVLPANVARYFTGYDVRFLDGHLLEGNVATQLEEALSLLNLVPTVWPTVCTLVKSLHILDAGGDETDISFSDPALPFSVFVSVPRRWSQVAPLRVAEAILHEAMHIQLTLVERVVSLVLPQRRMYYSPWRDEQRDSEGILQALYVFGVIRSFLRLMPLRGRQPYSVKEHVADRIMQIDRQIEQTQDFRECAELTFDGAALTARFFESKS